MRASAAFFILAAGVFVSGRSFAAPASRPAPNKAQGRIVADRVVAIVNDDTVLQSEWDEEWLNLRKTMPPEEAGDPEKETELKNRVLESLIRDRLISQEADVQKVAPKDEQVEFRLKEIRDKNFGGDQAQFEKALKAEGLSVDLYRDRLKKQIRQETLIYKEVQSKVAIGDQEVEEYYKAHEADFAESEERHLRHILVAVSPKPKPGDAAKAEAQAKKILAEVAGGASFEAVAKAKSGDPGTRDRGGDLGWVKKGELVPALENAVFSPKIAPGGLTPVLRGPLGYEILQLVEVRNPGKKKLDDKVSGPEGEATVRELVKGKLQNDRFRDGLEEWVKGLRSKATVILKD